MQSTCFTFCLDKTFFTVGPESGTGGGEAMCLSSGEDKQWLSVSLKICSSSQDLHQEFRLDHKGKLKNGRFVDYCLAPSYDEAANFVEVKLKHCEKVFDSWRRTSDGRITFSGSDKGITIASAQEGQMTFLHEPDSSYIQKWNINPV